MTTSSIAEHFIVYHPANPVIQRARDPSFTQYKDYATSPNGSFFAILAKNSVNKFTLSVFGSSTILRADSVIKVNDLYPDVTPRPLLFTDQADVKWSPDSKHVAIGFSKGQLIVVDWRNSQGICNVFEDIIPDCHLHGPSGFDFDPRSKHCVMTVAASDMALYRVNTEDKKILACCNDLGSFVDCFKYSYDSNYIVAALFSRKIKVLDTEDLSPLFEIDLTVLCPDFEDISQKLGSVAPNMTCLSLTSTGEQAAIACWDRKIRVVQLLKVLDLQCLCKFAILSVVTPSNVNKLPIPHLIKDYLYSFPYNP